MTTITIKINERTKAGRAFIAILSDVINNDVVGVEIDSNKLVKKDRIYNPEFVKMVLESAKIGGYKEVDPKDIRGSLISEMRHYSDK